METLPNNRIKLSFPYNRQLIDEVKVMKGVKAVPPAEGGWYWTIEDCERNRYAFEYLTGLRTAPDTYPIIGDLSSPRKLMDQQIEGKRFAVVGRRVLLGFDMGLGKTLTSIEVMEYALKYEGLYNWWLVAPYGAQQEWKRQLKKWKCDINFIVVTTYESLEKELESDFIPHGVIFDEAVKLKNSASKRSQVANELCRIVRTNRSPPVGERGGYIIELSGAIAPKNPIDWWHPIECLQPGFIREGDAHKFRNRYANIVTEDHGFGPHSVIASWKEDELVKLGRRLAPLVLVKKKKDCLNLPDKIFDVIEVEPSIETLATARLIVDTYGGGAKTLELLRELSDGFQYRDNKTTEPMHDVDDTGRIVNTSVGENGRTIPQNRAKIGVVRELLDFYHRDNGGPGRLVIYAAFQASVDMITEEINRENTDDDSSWRAARIDGRGWSDKSILDKFESSNNSNICIVANPACVHGLTLSQTLCLVYYSNSFHVDHRIQSIDRRDRPGMDVTKATRIVDIVHLPSDIYVVDALNRGESILNITLDELRRIYR